MKQRFFLLVLSLYALIAVAQKTVVVGTIVADHSNEPIEFATAALLSEGNVVTAATTNEQGKFTLSATPGRYNLRLSYIGYKTVTQTLNVQGDTLKTDTLRILGTEKTLAEAVVTATAAKVQQVGDTTMFNASAYRVPAGSTLEALVKQLPGVQVEDDGTITVNGKTVSEFLINGKDLFKGDTKVAMKNLPTEVVSKVKSYQKKSDYTEMTGIDDGEETTVLDFSTKRSLDNTWIINLDLAGGNKHRYNNRLFVARFSSNSSITSYGQMNNTGDQNFGGPRGFGGQSGLTTNKSAGINLTWDNGRKRRTPNYLETQLDLRYSHTNNDRTVRSSKEYFLTSGNTFAESLSNSRTSSTSFNTSGGLQWQIDSLTFVFVRASYRYNKGRENGTEQSATFNADPTTIEGADEETLYADQSLAPLDAITVNRNVTLSRSFNNSHEANTSVFAMRRLNARGRNVNFRGSIGWSRSDNEDFSIADVRYLQTGRTDFTHQYATEPSKGWNYSLRTGYTEPLGNNWYAEASYQYSYRYTKNDLSQYDLDTYTAWQNFASFGTLPSTADSLLMALDGENSKYATYRYKTHRFSLGVRYNTESIRFNAGLDFNPQSTVLDYNRPAQIDTTVTRNIFYVSPNMRLRWQFSKSTRLNLEYRGRASQPSMTNLLNVVNSNDPLNISIGNAGLKPSWTNSVRAEFETSQTEDYQQNISASLQGEQTSNSVSSQILYDATTGVRYSRPENISGNWNARAHFLFNRSLGYAQKFNISTNTNFNYDNAVGYISTAGSAITPLSLTADALNNLFDANPSTKNTTRTFAVREALDLTYRNDWFDVSLNTAVRYQHARATMLSTANMDTWNFSYGASGNFNFSWGMSVSTDIRMSSRRGYSSSAMNTNELLWNAQISQTLLGGKATVSLQFYDLLHQQSNLSRVLNATMRSDTWTNAINSYFLFRFVYKLNIIGGKGSAARQQEQQSRRFQGRPNGGFGGGLGPR